MFQCVSRKKLREQLHEVTRKLDLLLQYFEIDGDLSFYDNGETYYLVYNEYPRYMPMYGKCFVASSGKYGKLHKELKSIGIDKAVIITAKELEEKQKDNFFSPQFR